MPTHELFHELDALMKMAAATLNFRPVKPHKVPVLSILRSRAKKSNHRHCRPLLRTRGQRPSRRATDQADKVTPSHDRPFFR